MAEVHLSLSLSHHLCDHSKGEEERAPGLPLPTWWFSGKREGWEQETSQNTSQTNGNEYLKK